MKYNSIVLSGLPGAGKSILSKKLADYFKWKVRSIGAFWREQWQTLYPNAEISFEEYWRSITDKENKEMDKRLKKIVEDGNVVVDCRYGFLCRRLHALLVYTFSSLDTRANRALVVGKYPGKTLCEIKTKLIEREHDEVEYGKKVYGEDYRNILLYNLSLNTARFSIEQEADIIITLTDRK
jgi:cytidylate kinase